LKSNTTASLPTAILTGAAHRLGKAIARELFSRGCNIVLHYNQSAQAANQLADDFNQQREDSCVIVGSDLSEESASKHIVERAIQTFGRIDHLINNASIFYPTPFENLDELVLEKFIQTNMLTPGRLATTCFPYINRNHGSVVNIVDIYAQAGLSEHTAYNAAKSGLLGLTKQQALEFAPNVRVNALSPGAILWPPTDSNETPSELTEGQKKILENSAMKRLGSANDIAKTAAFLALDASYMTGTNINVDGGRRWYI